MKDDSSTIGEELASEWIKRLYKIFMNTHKVISFNNGIFTQQTERLMRIIFNYS